jgi:radical SAM protein with 4Fe4S-binding SPASM domain
MNSKSLKLGGGTVEQVSLNVEINIEKILNLFLKNIKFIKEVLIKEDEYAKELFEHLEKKKKLIFPVNKHVELFILSNKSNIKKITKYIIFRYKFFLAGKKKVNLGYPPYLLIEPVSVCNLRCPFCFQTDKTFTKKPFMGVMDFELFKNVVDEADNIGVGAITLGSRGEPTLAKKFKEMLEYISAKKNIFELKINTNGSFLTEDICHSIFKNNISQIIVSSDHYIKDKYEKLRVGSNFDKIVQKVDMLYEIRKKYYPDSFTEIRISGIDNEKNLDREKFYEFWIKRSDHVTAGFPLERWDTYKNEIHNQIKDPCENLWDRMYVWFDGKVNPCDADYKSYLSYGNVKNQSIKEIWNNNIIEKTRINHLNENRKSIVPCNKCGVTFC